MFATISDANYQGSANGTLVISPASGWDAWIAANFSEAQIAQGLAAGDVDPDGDKFQNLAEYALGLNPFVHDPITRPVRDMSGFWFEFQRPAGRTDVTCIAESSEDLELWNSEILEKKSEGYPESWRTGSADIRQFGETFSAPTVYKIAFVVLRIRCVSRDEHDEEIRSSSFHQ